jgi:D-3-phosphoglycerate dehydrogenase / 2-oxoglutarate reductase
MNILLLETIAPEAFQILEAAPTIRLFLGYEQSIESITSQNPIHAIITRGLGQVTEALLDNCPDLKVVARCGVGLDNVDVKAATARHIAVVNAPGSNASTVAEHTIGLMLMLQRNLYQGIGDVKNGNWAARSSFKSDELAGKTLGILGLGNIGSRVARIAEALGMDVIYSSKTKKNTHYQYADFETIIKESDILSLHLPLADETRNLINEATIAQMKPTAIVINMARAAIVNHEAILTALQNQKLGGYAADVPFLNPPTANDPFASHPKVLVTAHVSSLTATTYVYMCVQTVNNVLAILNGQAPQPDCIFNRLEL